ncbi:hypothetical protein BMAPRL20_0870 [Burkholderia mallei PRL-20]|nr:hypothetical protein BMA10247_A1522 [Burkholderia mallei NCTC 10247]AFR18898.1 hypothetical protein BPC006_II0967 [Burkholderia pseudomallei BPC006]EDK55302.1 hypothetical protein BMAFMH_E0317 [Burkholderia mallei FMH]EDK61288.1 hypothetical protein BMAJHU_I0305 [Burkholderia mallei JHU]EDK83718.1 hypothetical protein BMA721280_L0587 [Burkholderia mallei 2002721280]EDS82392.1 hypothetical protein BURPSS13_T0063 [Burkholderia pseudomallei S13]EEC37845.1 conserved hypothetical protein [Burkh
MVKRSLDTVDTVDTVDACGRARRRGDAARRYSAPWRGGSVSFTA